MHFRTKEKMVDKMKKTFFKSKALIILTVLILLLSILVLTYIYLYRGADEAIRKIMSGLPSFLTSEEYHKNLLERKKSAKKIKSNHLFVYYKDLGGLRTGDKVRYDGKEVGHVEIFWINPEEDKRYEVLFKFRDKNFRVKKNSKFYISTLGLRNEKYVGIYSPETEAEYLEKGSYVKGQESATMPLTIPLTE